MAIPHYSLYLAPKHVKALGGLVDKLENLYRKELESAIKKVVGDEDWQVTPLTHQDEHKLQKLNGYYFNLGFNYGDARGIGEIFPFWKRVYFKYEWKNRRKDDHFGLILDKIATVLRKKGYKIKYTGNSYMPKLYDVWKYKKKQTGEQ